jgi:hypothetical protein
MRHRPENKLAFRGIDSIHVQHAPSPGIDDRGPGRSHHQPPHGAFPHPTAQPMFFGDRPDSHRLKLAD